jgi:hypothetical protein
VLVLVIIMPIALAKTTRHPYRCWITWMAFNIRANGVGSWIRDPMTEKDTRCKEYFNPLGGRNTVRFLAADPKPGRFNTLMSRPSRVIRLLNTESVGVCLVQFLSSVTLLGQSCQV